LAGLPLPCSQSIDDSGRELRNGVFPRILPSMSMAMARRKRGAKIAAFSLLLAVLGGCQSPKYVNGRKVIGTRWLDGHVVYVLAPNEEDQAATQRALKESEDGAREVTFQPATK
jgi:hypothetical protein